MFIKRVIRAYFVFTMAVVTMAALTFNSTVNTYFASVFNIPQQEVKPISSAVFTASLIDDRPLQKSFLAFGERKDLLTLTTENVSSRAYASPGSKDRHLMDLVFNTNEEVMKLDKINFKVEGADSTMIENAYLVWGEEVLEGKASDGHFLFSGIDYELNPDSEGVLKVYVDLSTELSIGDRFRFDIEKAEDLSVVVGEHPYILNYNYPIRGKYISITRSRSWEKVDFTVIE